MACDFLDTDTLSPKERAILIKAARILEGKIRTAFVTLNSPNLVRQWLRLKFSCLDREMFGVVYLDIQNRYYRALIERGLWIESAELFMDSLVPPRYWGLYEALLETRNILRALAAARDHSTVSAAQIQARDELERMKNDDAE